MAKEWIVPDADLGCDGAYFDYQEIVRCKDCKYRDTDGYCQVLGDMFIHWESWDPVPDDFFCARGTRS